MGIIEAKEQDFIIVVKEISEDKDLEVTPKVIFYDALFRLCS